VAALYSKKASFLNTTQVFGAESRTRCAATRRCAAALPVPAADDRVKPSGFHGPPGKTFQFLPAKFNMIICKFVLLSA
jgi:hypothetical protein